MLDIYRARAVIESALAREAAIVQAGRAILTANQLVMEMTELLESGRRPEAARVHRQLHFDLYRLANSPWLERLAAMLWDNGDRHLRYSPTLRPSMAQFGREHQLIVDAVASGDPGKAESAVAAHLMNAARPLSDRLRQHEQNVLQEPTSRAARGQSSRLIEVHGSEPSFESADAQ